MVPPCSERDTLGNEGALRSPLLLKALKEIRRMALPPKRSYALSGWVIEIPAQWSQQLLSSPIFIDFYPDCFWNFNLIRKPPSGRFSSVAGALPIVRYRNWYVSDSSFIVAFLHRNLIPLVSTCQSWDPSDVQNPVFTVLLTDNTSNTGASFSHVDDLERKY